MTDHWPSQNVRPGTRSDARKRLVERLEAEEAARERDEALAELSVPHFDRGAIPE
jgi:hypothetical protein